MFQAVPILASNYQRYSKNDSLTRQVRESTRFPIDTIIFKPLNKSIVIVHFIPAFFLPNLSFKGLV
jgi:hypothetical protein